MRKLTALIAVAVVLGTLFGCSQPQGTANNEEQFISISDSKKSVRIISDIAGKAKNQIEAAKAEAETEEATEEAYEEEYYEPEYYGYTTGYSGVSGDPDGLNSFVGIIDGPNGTRETAYSSNKAYHYRTSEWAPDEYGFYRTDEGYYVVASNDYEQGTVIETSRGEAMVLDGGCDSGIVDFYTNW